jgi:hypothetical protein
MTYQERGPAILQTIVAQHTAPMGTWPTRPESGTSELTSRFANAVWLLLTTKELGAPRQMAQ